MARLLNGLIALMLLCALQLHLPLLQVAAWSGMLVSYSREAPLREAVEMTFDGEHPCPMCLAISEAWDEGPAELLTNTAAPELQLGIPAPHAALGIVLSAEGRQTPMEGDPAQRADPPPAPPPRLAGPHPHPHPLVG